MCVCVWEREEEILRCCRFCCFSFAGALWAAIVTDFTRYATLKVLPKPHMTWKNEILLIRLDLCILFSGGCCALKRVLFGEL